MDWITFSEIDDLDPSDRKIFVEILKVHYKAVVYTIQNAIKIIENVNSL